MQKNGTHKYKTQLLLFFHFLPHNGSIKIHSIQTFSCAYEKKKKGMDLRRPSKKKIAEGQYGLRP